jgi:cell division septation protein DedD
MQRILMFDEPQRQPSAESNADEEFELVVGHRQIAAITFLALVMVAVCSGASYLAGKVISAREEPVQPIILEQPPAPSPTPAPLIEATIVPPAAAPVPSESAIAPKVDAEAPLFASPVPKAIYIQVGAVEKGVATVIAEGLRKHALDSFVAPGPTEKTFRVLIGPFPNAEAYQKARNIVDQIGLASFARQYQPL